MGNSWLETVPVIDVHCHIDLDWHNIQTTPSMMLNLMTDEGVVYGLCLGRDYEKDLPDIEQYPDTAGYLWWVDPSEPGYLDKIRELVLMKHPQVKGFKLHPPSHGFIAGVDTLFELFSLANEHSLMIATHTADMETCRAGQFRELMEEFSETVLLLYHACPVEETISMINDFPNVYTDTSFTAGNPLVQKRLLEAVDHSKILFGIDSPLGFPKNEITYLPHYREFVVEEFAQWYDYDRGILEMVLYKNASNLLNLEIAK